MDIGSMMKSVAHAVDAATPGNMKPVGQVRPSTPFKWAVFALIGNLICIFGVFVYIVMVVYGSSQWPHSPEIVLEQLKNQRQIATGILILLAIDTLAIVYAAARVTFSGSIGVASFSMGGDGSPAPAPQPVATVTVSAPATSTVDVATASGAEPSAAAEPEFEPEPAADPAPALPIHGASPSKYGD